MMRLSNLMVGKSREPGAPGGRKTRQLMIVSAMVSAWILGLPGPVLAVEPLPGKALVMDKRAGNCIACHMIADGEQPGNIGPPLVAMKARFPDEEVLRKQIWDATKNNPSSRMPPFGRHGILNHEEIDLIIAYLYTL